MYSFPYFPLTCFDTLSCYFAYDFVLLYYRSNSSVVNSGQSLLEFCPFWKLEYWKYTVFCIFLLHALTYWAEILHMTLFYCTSDQVRVSSIHLNFCRSNAPFGTWPWTTGNTQFSAPFSYVLWHIELKFYIWLCLMYCRSSSSVITLCTLGSPSIYPSHFCIFLLQVLTN